MSQALWSGQRPEFIERVAALAGGTTYRVPTAGKGTRMDQLPDPHAIATALGFARCGPGDVGPDVAYCWVLQTDAYRHRTVPMLALGLRCRRFRSVAAYRLHAAGAAWDRIIWNRQTPRPADARPDYDLMELVACATLEESAWDALYRAERAYRRRA